MYCLHQNHFRGVIVQPFRKIVLTEVIVPSGACGSAMHGFCKSSKKMAILGKVIVCAFLWVLL